MQPRTWHTYCGTKVISGPDTEISTAILTAPYRSSDSEVVQNHHQENAPRLDVHWCCINLKKTFPVMATVNTIFI